MYSWLVNTLIIYYHQLLTNGSHFALIYIIITQLPPLQRNYSNCTNLCGKNSVTLSAVNAWNKIQIVFRNVILRTLTTTQIKTLLTKKCIEKY